MGGGGGGQEGWSEVLRRVQSRQGAVAYRGMEGLGITAEEGGVNEQISMEMEGEIRGMAGCNRGICGKDKDGI